MYSRVEFFDIIENIFFLYEQGFEIKINESTDCVKFTIKAMYYSSHSFAII